ncbi:hypothetical protein GALL_450690 [mine drainage metagenome]|uniref:Uncharacterized protein n=1 Tax=mine drainage metagenome TaxID=410659 RepID=A0A1J5PR81_9ZZZZ
MLREVIEDDEYALALVHPVLADGRAGIRREVLEAGWVGCGCCNDGRVFECAGFFKSRTDRCNRGALLADCHVDALDLLLRVAGLPVLFLVDDRVDRDRSLTGLAVADDELALPAADCSHGVDGLDTSLHGLFNWLTLNDGRGLKFENASRLGLDLALAVDRVAKWVYNAA